MFFYLILSNEVSTIFEHLRDKEWSVATNNGLGKGG